RARRGPWAAGGKSQQSHIATQTLQLTPAFRASLEMRLHFYESCALQSAESEIVSELFVRVHRLQALRRRSRPARMRVLIVPKGSPVFSAISVCVSPSKKLSSSAARCDGGMPTRGAR